MTRFAPRDRACALGFALLAIASVSAFADTVVGVTAGNDLVTFDSATPGTIIRTVAVTGLQASENIVALDFRPSDGRLYAISNQSRIYVIDRLTGAVTIVGAQIAPVLGGGAIGMDFNPVVDRIRIVSETDENLRLNPDTGAIAGTDTNLAYSVLDPNELSNPFVVAAAYDRSVAGGAATTLFGIDTALDNLVRQGGVNGTPISPNVGSLNTIGPLGVDAGPDTSLDIAGSTAYAAITLNAGTSTGLYTVDLATGSVTLIGTIGGGEVIRGMAVAPVRFVGVTIDDEIVTFRANSPGTVLPLLPITGLQVGEHILAVDVRPATGQLYGFANTSRLYRIDPTSGAVTRIGQDGLTPTPTVTLTGTAIGMDFNPVADRIRIVTETGENLRLHPDTGAVIDTDDVTTGVQIDTALTFVPGDPNQGGLPQVTAAAYDHSVAGATTTTLFGLDSELGVLVRQGSVGATPTSPNSGQLTTIGSLGFATKSDFIAFDIAGSGDQAYAVVTPTGGATSALFTIDLATGATSLVGVVGGGKVIRSAAIATEIQPAAVPSGNFFALTTANVLFPFEAGTPGLFGAPIQITGLKTGEDIVAIDLRPSTRVLFGISNQSRLYAINRTTGVVLLIGTGPFSPGLTGTDYGVDFNPVADRIRIVSDADKNLRLNPETGDVVDGDAAASGTQGDATLAFAAGDPNSAANPNVVGVAYDRNTLITPAATTLFGIDSNLDVLVRQGSVDGAPNSPNTGELTTIGPLGVNAGGTLGFEIAADGTAVAAIDSGGSKLYTIDLATGAASFVGQLGSGAVIRGIAIAPLADLPTPLPLTVTKLDIKIDFAKTPKDSLSVSGSIPEFTGDPSGKVVVVNAGGVVRTFTLDSKGKAKVGDASFTLGKPKKGLSTYSMSVKKADISDNLADENLTGTADVKKVQREIIVIFTFDGTTRSDTVTLEYTAKTGKTGTAKRAKVQ